MPPSQPLTLINGRAGSSLERLVNRLHRESMEGGQEAGGGAPQGRVHGPAFLSQCWKTGSLGIGAVLLTWNACLDCWCPAAEQQ